MSHQATRQAALWSNELPRVLATKVKRTLEDHVREGALGRVRLEISQSLSNGASAIGDSCLRRGASVTVVSSLAVGMDDTCSSRASTTRLPYCLADADVIPTGSLVFSDSGARTAVHGAGAILCAGRSRLRGQGRGYCSSSRAGTRRTGTQPLASGRKGASGFVEERLGDRVFVCSRETFSSSRACARRSFASAATNMLREARANS